MDWNQGLSWSSLKIYVGSSLVGLRLLDLQHAISSKWSQNCLPQDFFCLIFRAVVFLFCLRCLHREVAPVITFYTLGIRRREMTDFLLDKMIPHRHPVSLYGMIITPTAKSSHRNCVPARRHAFSCRLVSAVSNLSRKAAASTPFQPSLRHLSFCTLADCSGMYGLW